MSLNGLPYMVGNLVALKMTTDLAMNITKIPKRTTKRRKY